MFGFLKIFALLMSFRSHDSIWRKKTSKLSMVTLAASKFMRNPRTVKSWKLAKIFTRCLMLTRKTTKFGICIISIGQKHQKKLDSLMVRRTTTFLQATFIVKMQIFRQISHRSPATFLWRIWLFSFRDEFGASLKFRWYKRLRKRSEDYQLAN